MFVHSWKWLLKITFGFHHAVIKHSSDTKLQILEKMLVTQIGTVWTITQHQHTAKCSHHLCRLDVNIYLVNVYISDVCSHILVTVTANIRKTCLFFRTRAMYKRLPFRFISILLLGEKQNLLNHDELPNPEMIYHIN